MCIHIYIYICIYMYICIYIYIYISLCVGPELPHRAPRGPEDRGDGFPPGPIKLNTTTDGYY